jgi:hypothetical protein
VEEVERNQLSLASVDAMIQPLLVFWLVWEHSRGSFGRLTPLVSLLSLSIISHPKTSARRLRITYVVRGDGFEDTSLQIPPS